METSGGAWIIICVCGGILYGAKVGGEMMFCFARGGCVLANTNIIKSLCDTVRDLVSILTGKPRWPALLN